MSSGYYLIERVIDKAIMDKMMHKNLHIMAGYQRTPDLVCITKRSKSLFPLLYYTHINNIESSPVKAKKEDDYVTAYSYCPQEPKIIEDLAGIGVNRLVLHSQFFRDVPSPRSLEFDCNAWFERYAEFRQTCFSNGIELHVIRIAMPGYFIAPLYDGITPSMKMILSSLRPLKLESYVDLDHLFPKKKWVATTPVFAEDHFRKEHIQLIADSDMRHVHGHFEYQDKSYIVVKTNVIERYNGTKTWSLLKERLPLAERKGIL